MKGLGAALPLAVPGQALEGTVARHPWIDRDVPVLAADFVAMDAGTGLVHIAPGHGEEDYELGRKAGLEIYNPVDDDGRFIAEVAHFAGPDRLGGQPEDHRAPARGGALVGRRSRSATATRTAGAARTRRSSAPPSSGSSRMDKNGLRQKALAAIGTR